MKLKLLTVHNLKVQRKRIMNNHLNQSNRCLLRLTFEELFSSSILFLRNRDNKL